MVRHRKASGSVHADHGGVAAGRDIRDSTIHVGLDEQAVGRLLQENFAPLVAQLSHDKGVPAAPLHVILAKLGEASIPDHEILTRLDAAAEEVISLRAQLARLRNDRPELAAIREQALALIDRGDLDQARAVLNKGREVARVLREDASRSEAELL